MKYKAYRIVDGKPRWVIADENGKIVNRNPNKDELQEIEKEPYHDKRDAPRSYIPTYKDEKLLNELRRFEKENGRPPTVEDFTNNPEYPGFNTYQRRFGSWSNGLKLVGLDNESMVKKGVLETSQQKARLAEIMVRDHFKKNPVDLAGENYHSHCDGLCPNGKIYDVKGSKLYRGTFWNFNIHNKYKEEIEIFYFLAFNEDYTKLKYGWRVPGEIVESDNLMVGLNPNSYYKFTVENMKEYDITDKINKIIKE